MDAHIADLWDSSSEKGDADKEDGVSPDDEVGAGGADVAALTKPDKDGNAHSNISGNQRCLLFPYPMLHVLHAYARPSKRGCHCFSQSVSFS